MLRRPFDAVVIPTVSYGSEVCVPEFSQVYETKLKAMAGAQA